MIIQSPAFFTFNPNCEHSHINSLFKIIQASLARPTQPDTAFIRRGREHESSASVG